MKKFCLSLLVSIMAIFGCVMFVSCGPDNSYKLSNLQKDYTEMIAKYEYLVKDNNKFKFDYSKFTLNNTQYFVNANADPNLPYHNLETVYNPILNNSLEFVGNYLTNCSTDDYKVDKTSRNELKKCLDELDEALSKTHLHTINVATIIRSGGDLSTNVHMNRLSKLFESYNELYDSVFNFSRALEKVFYNNILEDSNPDYSATPLSQFDANNVIGAVNLQSKIKKQVVNLTENYAIRQIIGSNLAEELTTKIDGSFVSINLKDYTDSVNAIKNVSFSPSIGEIINLSDKKETFYNASIRLYNVQANLDNNYSAYLTAFRDVVYTEAAADENANEYDKICVQIIDARHALIQEYNTALIELLEIISSFSSQS